MYAPPPLLNLVVIRVKDLDAARLFYEAMGVTFDLHKHGRGAEHLTSEMGEGAPLLEIYPLRDGQTPTTSVRLGFRVHAIDSCIQKILTAGGNVIEQVHSSEWGRRAVVQDPEGHKIELLSMASCVDAPC